MDCLLPGIRRGCREGHAAERWPRPQQAKHLGRELQVAAMWVVEKQLKQRPRRSDGTCRRGGSSRRRRSRRRRRLSEVTHPSRAGGAAPAGRLRRSRGLRRIRTGALGKAGTAAPGLADEAAAADGAAGTGEPPPLSRTSLYEGNPSEEGPEEGDASLHRWSLERPNVAQGVEQGAPSGAGEGEGWVVGAPGLGSGERLVELGDGAPWGGGGAGATGAICV